MRSPVFRGRQPELAALRSLVFAALAGLAGLVTTPVMGAGALNLPPTPVVASEGTGQFTVAAKNGGASGGGAVVRWVGPGAAAEVITAFDPASTGGFSPAGSLLQASDGYWYGATANGATATNGSFNLDGLLYRLREDGTDRTVVHQFLGALGGEGRGPQGGCWNSAWAVSRGFTERRSGVVRRMSARCSACIPTARASRRWFTLMPPPAVPVRWGR